MSISVNIKIPISVDNDINRSALFCQQFLRFSLFFQLKKIKITCLHSNRKYLLNILLWRQLTLHKNDLFFIAWDIPWVQAHSRMNVIISKLILTLIVWLGHSQEVSEVKLDAKIFKMSNLHFYLPGLEAIKSHYCLFNILVGRNVSI